MTGTSRASAARPRRAALATAAGSVPREPSWPRSSSLEKLDPASSAASASEPLTTLLTCRITGPVGDAHRDRIRSGHNRERLGHGLQRCIECVLARSTPSGVRESLERLLGDAFHFP